MTAMFVCGIALAALLSRSHDPHSLPMDLIVWIAGGGIAPSTSSSFSGSSGIMRAHASSISALTPNTTRGFGLYCAAMPPNSLASDTPSATHASLRTCSVAASA